MEELIVKKNKFIIEISDVFSNKKFQVEIDKKIDKEELVKKIEELAREYILLVGSYSYIDVRKINDILIINGKEINLKRDVEEILTISLSIMSSEFNRLKVIIGRTTGLLSSALGTINEFKNEIMRNTNTPMYSTPRNF